MGNRVYRGTALAVALIVSACGGGGSDGAPVDGAGGGGDGPADVRIALVGPAAALPGGGSGELVLTVSNGGASAAQDVVVGSALGTGLTAGTPSCTATAGAICPASLGPSLGNIGDLPGGSSLVLRLPIHVATASSGATTVGATVGAANDASASNNHAGIVVQTYSADVRAAAYAPTYAVKTARVEYTLTVTNIGPDAASEVAVLGAMDAGQSLEAVSCAAGGGAICPDALGASMTVASLPKDGVLTFMFSGRVPSAASGTAGVSITATAAGDPNLANNAVSAAAIVTAPNSVALQSEFGDYIGTGTTRSYSQANAVFTTSASGGRLSLSVAGDEDWFGTLVLPDGQSTFQPGVYANLTRSQLDWWGEGRGCNTVAGSFTVTDARYENGNLIGIDFSFEQHCEGMAPALRGQVHWTSADPTAPAGPVSPPPANLWAPAAGATPASGNYVYLRSDAGDYIGAGTTQTLTPADALMSVAVNGPRVSVSIAGNDTWSGEFQAMNGQTQLRPGHYANLQRWPFHNPTRGGLSWSGAGRGCNTLSGWFVIDAIGFNDGALSSLDLRFEQHCEGQGPALRGKIHWTANDPTAPPGPVNPPPAGLWSAPAGATPASGNYVYLQSSPGDYIGAGQTLTYTPADAAVSLTGIGGRASIGVDSPGGWSGDFQAMSGLTRLQTGYYGDLRRYPFHNPARGGLSWSGQGRGCNTLTGWFVVDAVSYMGGALKSIDLRFEQSCEGFMPPLRGQIHWVL